MLIINPPLYKGRFLSRAKFLLREGKRVGEVWVDETPQGWTCHVCETSNPKPKMDQNKDAWQECQGCCTPFVIRKA